MKNARNKRTPDATYVKLTKYDQRVIVDQSVYRSIIGSQLYLITSIRDITFYVDGCSCFYQDSLKMTPLTQFKRIIKYITGTSDFGLIHSIDTKSFLVRYCEAGWARKS